MPTLRFASVDARSFPRDRAGLAAALAAADAQVAVVHNGPHLGRWRTLSATIARRAGLVVVGGGRRGGANLILSSLSVDFVSTTDVPFSHDPLHPAGAALARLRRGSRFAIGGVSLRPDSAAADSAVLRAALSELACLPLVLSVQGDPRPLADLGRLVGQRLLVPESVGVGAVHDGEVLVAELTLPDAD